MRNGVRTSMGILRVRRATVIRQGEKNTWLQVVLDEGKNRQIRRVLQEIGIEVLRIVRVAIGPLPLGDLPKGKVRRLSESEKSALDLSITPSRQPD